MVAGAALCRKLLHCPAVGAVYVAVVYFLSHFVGQSKCGSFLLAVVFGSLLKNLPYLFF